MIIPILLVFGFVLFVLSGLGVPNPPRFELMNFGLAFWILAEIVRIVWTH